MNTLSPEMAATLAAFGLNTFAWLAMTFVQLRVKSDLSELRAHIAEHYVSKSDVRNYLKGVSHVP